MSWRLGSLKSYLSPASPHGTSPVPADKISTQTSATQGTGSTQKSPLAQDRSTVLKSPNSFSASPLIQQYDVSPSPLSEEHTSTLRPRVMNAGTFWKLLALVLILCFGIYRAFSFLTHTHYGPALMSPSEASRKHPKRHCPNLPEAPYPSLDQIGRHYPQPVNYSRMECQCVGVHNFVILSMQRSGSGWFETLLNNHPQVSSHGEVFSVRPRRQNMSTIGSTLGQIYNLDWVSSAVKDKACTSAVGLKWMLNQGALEYHREVLEFFRENKVSVIFLLRRNLLRRMVSILANAHDRKNKLLNGKHKSHVHSKEEAKTLAEFRPTIHAKHLIGNLEKVLDMAEDGLREFNSTRNMVVYYEDVTKNTTILREVQKFLGVEVRKLTSKQVRIHTRPIREQVENWDAVFKKLNGTKFQSFLNDK